MSEILENLTKTPRNRRLTISIYVLETLTRYLINMFHLFCAPYSYFYSFNYLFIRPSFIFTKHPVPNIESSLQ